MAGQYATQSMGNAPHRVRVWTPPDVPLVRCAIGGTLTNAFVQFGFPTPDARILLKLSILFYREVTGQTFPVVVPFDSTLNGQNVFSLSVQSADRAPTGAWLPTKNIVGAGRSSSLTMQQIPLSTPFLNVDNLDGFSIDIQGGQEAVVCAFQAVSAVVQPQGLVIIARARYNLVQAEMCDDEWEAAKAQMSPFASPAVLF